MNKYSLSYNQCEKEFMKILDLYEREIGGIGSDGFDMLLDHIIVYFGCIGYKRDKFFDENHKYKFSMKSHQLFVQLINIIGQASDNLTDFLGDMYEKYQKTASKAKAQGQFFTPQTISRFMAQILDVHYAETVADPAGCGSGRMLLEAYRCCKESKKSFMRITDSRDNEIMAEQGMCPNAFGIDLCFYSVRMTLINLMLNGGRGVIAWCNCTRRRFIRRGI